MIARAPGGMRPLDRVRHRGTRAPAVRATRRHAGSCISARTTGPRSGRRRSLARQLPTGKPFLARSHILAGGAGAHGACERQAEMIDDAAGGVDPKTIHHAVDISRRCPRVRTHSTPPLCVPRQGNGGNKRHPPGYGVDPTQIAPAIPAQRFGSAIPGVRSGEDACPCRPGIHPGSSPGQAIAGTCASAATGRTG